MTERNIELKINYYEETRRRITRFTNKHNISDREIIEELAKEINQYRERITKQKEYINKLNNKTIQNETIETYTTEDNEVMHKDIVEITTITTYVDGKPRKTITDYRYKED